MSTLMFGEFLGYTKEAGGFPELEEEQEVLLFQCKLKVDYIFVIVIFQ